MNGASPSRAGLWEIKPAGGEALANFLLSLEDTGLVRRIAHYLQEQGCRTALVERRHADREYFQEYLYFYSTAFRQYPPTTDRIHFFAADPDRVESLLAQPPARSVARALRYLGSVVFRPTFNRRVCTTLLRPPAKVAGRRVSAHCVTHFPSTVRGHRLPLVAAPFIGQDETGRCAQTALWGGLQYLHRHRYYDGLSMPEITHLVGRESPATTFTRPAQGLADWEMYLVLRAIGFQVYYNERPPDGPMVPSAAESIYTTLESALPAFISLRVNRGPDDLVRPRHAVWAVAHTLDEHVAPERQLLETVPAAAGSEPPVTYLSRSRWIAHVLVHDDNAGPYAPCRIYAPPSQGSNASSPADQLTYCGYGKRGLGATLPPPYSASRALVDNVIIPLPPEVFVKPPEAVAMAVLALKTDHLSGLCEEAERRLGMKTPPQTQAFLATIAASQRRYAFRTFLSPADYFREHVASCQSMSRVLTDAYLTRLDMPEYVWITEITDTHIPGGMGGTADGVVGEIVVDSTDSPALHTGMGFSYISLHVPGLLVMADPAAEEYVLVPLPSDDRPHRPFDRLVHPHDAPRPHRDFGPPRLWEAT